MNYLKENASYISYREKNALMYPFVKYINHRLVACLDLSMPGAASC